MASKCLTATLSIVLLIVGLALGLLIGYFVFKPPGDFLKLLKSRRSLQSKSCSESNKELIYDDKRRRIFEMPTADELLRVKDCLVEKGVINSFTGLPKLKSNYIYSMEFLQPDKTAALAYLDGTGSNPGRYVKVRVYRGNNTTPGPDVMTYSVGPLDAPVADMTHTAKSIEGTTPYTARTSEYTEGTAMEALVKKEFKKIDAILKETFDGATLDDGLVLNWLTGPAGTDKAGRIYRIALCFDVLKTNSYFLNRLPLAAEINVTNLDPSTWKMKNLFYFNQGPFTTIEEFKLSLNDGLIRKYSYPVGYRKNLIENDFMHRRVADKPRPHSDKSPPKTYEPDGKRYEVSGHSIKYMNWELTVATGMRGPRVYDVKYKGDRIIYENGLSEIVVTYAGDDLVVGNTIYYDTNYGIGLETFDLIKGVDCPEHATYLETTVWITHENRPHTAKAICVYEADGEQALWRHKDSYSQQYAGGLRNSYLVVRFAAAIVNYDYNFDFQFWLDGRIKSTVAATGILQNAAWLDKFSTGQDSIGLVDGSDESVTPYGYRVSKSSIGAVHDHTFGFKIDMDIIDRNNRFYKIDWKAGSFKEAYGVAGHLVPENFKPAYQKYKQTRYIVPMSIKRETSFNITMDKPSFWIMTSDQKKNDWNVRRGYRIIPLLTGSQVYTSEQDVMLSAGFTKNHLLLTKYSETEPALTGDMDLFRLADPLVRFQEQAVNNEPIEGNDIVAWLSLSFLHVPTAEDYPMTSRIETGYWLRPWNFFNRADVFDMPHFLQMDGTEKYSNQPPISKKPCIPAEKNTCYYYYKDSKICPKKDMPTPK